MPFSFNINNIDVFTEQLKILNACLYYASKIGRYTEKPLSKHVEKVLCFFFRLIQKFNECL